MKDSNLPENTGIAYVALCSEDWKKFVEDGQPLTVSEAWCAAYGNLDLTYERSANLYFVFYPEQDGYTGLLDPDDDVVRYAVWSDNMYRTRLGRYVKDGRGVYKIDHLHYMGNTNLIPQGDPEYACYMDALGDPSIVAVVVTGAAGTGKSYAAIRQGYNGIHEGLYMSGIVAKEGKNEMGAVKGGVEEKMAPIIAFATSNLASIIMDSGKLDGYYEEDTPPQSSGSTKKRKFKATNSGKTAHESLNDLVDMEWKRNWEARPYRYLAGCSLRNVYYVLDEFQRVSTDDADTLITRVGDGSKMIIIGDIAQIEHATEDRRRVNGLTYAQSLTKGAPMAARIHLRVNLRSGLVDWIVRRRPAVREEFGLPF